MNRREAGGDDRKLMELPHDCVKWWALVVAMLNLWILLPAVSIVTVIGEALLPQKKERMEVHFLLASRVLLARNLPDVSVRFLSALGGGDV